MMTFQVKKVGHQSFLVSMLSPQDYENISKKRYDWLNFDLSLVRIWEPMSDIAKYLLDSISK